MLRDQIQCVGVDDERLRDRDRALQKTKGYGVGAESGPDQQTIAFIDDRVCIGEHQLERCDIDGRSFERNESDPHLAGANFHRCASRKKRRTDHAMSATDNGERSERSLVDVAPIATQCRRQCCRQSRPFELAPRRAGCLLDIDVERVDRNGTAKIDAIAGQQSRLECEKCRGGISVDRR